MIEAAGTAEPVRTGALEALAYLMATDRIARDEAEAYLLRLSTLEPQHGLRLERLVAGVALSGSSRGRTSSGRRSPAA